MAIMKLNALAQMKNVSPGIRNLPFFGDPGNNIEVLVAMHQCVKDQFINTF
jgi:hypothetical protein